MKSLLITLVSLTLTTSAFAKSSAVSFAQLEKDAHEAQMLVEGANGCGFDASVHAGVLVLRLTEGNKQVVVEVKEDARISMVDKAKSTDDSQKVYRTGGAELEILLASDAFNEVTLTDAKGNSAQCEVDM